MDVTRRFWEVVTLAGGLAGAAVLLASPLLLAGALTLGAWVLAIQIRFIRNLNRTLEALTIDQSVTRDRATTDEDLPVTLEAILNSPSRLSLTITATPPVAATGIDAETCQIDLPAGTTTATTTATHAYPIAGEFTFDSPRIHASDQHGLFTETVSHGPTPSVTVDPRVPREIHIGEGGERIATAYGEHPAGRLGSGLDPAELREYIPGDPARRIDWKASARLNRPYIREYEVETDRQTAIVLDHRATTAIGPTGRTAFEYLRDVALAFVTNAQQLDDPLGLYVVGEEGLTASTNPDRSSVTYNRIRRQLLDLRPMEQPASPSRPAVPRPSGQAIRQFQAEDTVFSRTLQPFLASTQTYEFQTGEHPLVETIRRRIRQLDGTVWTVIFTDDGDRQQLREAVKLARAGDGRVAVFLAPQILFESGSLADIEPAYERYADFEEFRSELARLDRVSAFEVAPDERLKALLASQGPGRTRASP